MADLALAILHHVLAFSLAAIIAAELVLLRTELTSATIKRLVGIDRYYGVIAGLIMIVGAARLYWGLKGWEFFLFNWPFWAKMAAFLLVGLLSIIPTIRFISWRREANADANFQLPAGELATVKKLVHAEALLFILIPVLAAVMARAF